MPFAFSSGSQENDTLDLANDLSFNPFRSLSPDSQTFGDWRDNGHSTSHADSELTHHPLRRSSSGKGNSTGTLGDDNAGITRPHLTRILHAFNGSASSTPPDDDTTTPTTPPLEQDERLVQVHQVTPTDSLQGVALRYKIPLAELRKANHLWANDSIHLRNVLYIPIRPSPPIHTHDNTSSEYSSSRSSLSDNNESASPSTIRIPASQLSFFPPSSTKSSALSPSTAVYPNKLTSAHRRAATTPYLTTIETPSNNNSLTPSNRDYIAGPPTLTQIRDTLIARISFESSRTASSISDEHELDDVSSRGQDETEMGISYTTDTGTLRSENGRNRRSRTCTDPDRNSHERHRHHDHDAIPLEWRIIPDVSLPSGASKPPLASIRTAQLEPSPGMKLPTPMTNKGRARDSNEADARGRVRPLSVHNGEEDGTNRP